MFILFGESFINGKHNLIAELSASTHDILVKYGYCKTPANQKVVGQVSPEKRLCVNCVNRVKMKSEGPFALRLGNGKVFVAGEKIKT